MYSMPSAACEIVNHEEAPPPLLAPPQLDGETWLVERYVKVRFEVRRLDAADARQAREFVDDICGSLLLAVTVAGAPVFSEFV